MTAWLGLAYQVQQIIILTLLPGCLICCYTGVPACYIDCLLASCTACLPSVCNCENAHADKDMFSDVLLCYLVGHSEDIVLSTLEKWLQEEAHCKGQQAQVSLATHFYSLSNCNLVSLLRAYKHGMCAASIPCCFCKLESYSASTLR